MSDTEPDAAERAALGAALAGDDWRAAMPGVKRRQAHAADDLAAVASGIGEYGIANACYRLAGILRQHAAGDYSSMEPGQDITTPVGLVSEWRGLGEQDDDAPPFRNGYRAALRKCADELAPVAARVAATEKERIAKVAEDLGAHYHERLERTRGRSASFADFLRGAKS